MPRLRVVVTGTECTGKTTLAAELGLILDWPVTPEGARLLVEELERSLEFADLRRLADLHRRYRSRALQRARRRHVPGIVLDTDLYSSWVYAEHYMGSVPDWLKRSARAGGADLYLYCEADVPFVADPLQRGSRSDRQKVDRALSALLRAEGRRVVSVSGSRTHRVRLAAHAVAELLAAGSNTKAPGPRGGGPPPLPERALNSLSRSCRRRPTC